MPNPPFQPLTLSVEEIERALKLCSVQWEGQASLDLAEARAKVDEYHVGCALRVVFAAAQEAASLRQRLEELNDNATKIHVEDVREQNNLRAHRDELLERAEAQQGQLTWAGDHVKALSAQLAQAQQELMLNGHMLTAARTQRDEAEAALEEIRKHEKKLSFGLGQARHGYEQAIHCKIGWNQPAFAKGLMAPLIEAVERVLAELQRRRSPTGQEG